MRNGNKHRVKLKNARAAMKPYDFESLSTDELWALHEKIAATLAGKLAAEKTRLEKRLRPAKPGSWIKRQWQKRRPRSPDLIRRFFRNTEILRKHPKLGPVAGSRRAGYQHNSDLEKN
jgi:hypothetical protein